MPTAKLKNNNKKFDLILIKQTIHLLNFREIKKLISFCKTKLKKQGKILIFTLEISNNEIPTFSLSKKIEKIVVKIGAAKEILTTVANGNFLKAIKIATKAINPDVHLRKCKPGLFVL